MDGQTDRRTDGIAIAYTRCSIYAVARKIMQKSKIYRIIMQKIEYLQNGADD